jgi:hypothetical protein
MAGEQLSKQPDEPKKPTTVRLRKARRNVNNARSAVLQADTATRADKKQTLKAKTDELNLAWRKSAFIWSSGVVAAAGLAALGVGVLGALDRVSTKGCTTSTCPAHWHLGVLTTAQFALAIAGPITAAVLLLVGWVGQGRTRGGLIGFIVGRDNRLSTSKLQVGLWTITVVFAFFFFLFQIVRGSAGHAFDSLDPAYLLLLGGPFAAEVLAQAATTAKTGDGTVQQVPATAPTGSDVVKNHVGDPAIADTQFLLFNLVALTYFAIALAKVPTALPKIPTTLVALTSVSALTYLGAKAISSNQPMISSVSIISGSADGLLHPGTRIRIMGANFKPSEDQPETHLDVVVLFDAVEATVTGAELTNTEIEVATPSGVPAGPVKIAVRTAAGIVTNVHDGMKFQPRSPGDAKAGEARGD